MTSNAHPVFHPILQGVAGATRRPSTADRLLDAKADLIDKAIALQQAMLDFPQRDESWPDQLRAIAKLTASASLAHETFCEALSLHVCARLGLDPDREELGTFGIVRPHAPNQTLEDLASWVERLAREEPWLVSDQPLDGGR